VNACERVQELMPEALYGELDPSRVHELNEHLGGCAPCAALYAELGATLETMGRRERPDPGAAFWDGYWQRLQDRVAREETVAAAGRFGPRRPLVSWGYRVAATVAVLAAGVWIGRTVLAPRPGGGVSEPATANVSPQSGTNPQQQEFALDSGAGPRAGDGAARPPIDAPPGEERDDRIAGTGTGPGVVTAANSNGEALRYLGRSQVVLLALLNGSGDGDAGGFGSERAQARVLVAEGQKIQDELTRPEDRRLRDLVGQLEMILREIANLEADSDLDAVQMIRNRVDRESVLLRIDLQQLRESSAPGSEGGNKARAFD
jgi:hypothetical protein